MRAPVIIQWYWKICHMLMEKRTIYHKCLWKNGQNLKIVIVKPDTIAYNSVG